MTTKYKRKQFRTIFRTKPYLIMFKHVAFTFIISMLSLYYEVVYSQRFSHITISFSLVFQFFGSFLFRIFFFFRYSHFTPLMLFFCLDLCDVFIIIYFWMSPVLYFSLQFTFSLNFWATKVILLSNKAAFIPLSSSYHTSQFHMNISAAHLCRTTIWLYFSPKLVFFTSDFNLLYPDEFCP